MFKITEETKKEAVDKMIEILLFERIDNREKFEEAFDAAVAIVMKQFGISIDV
jgi:hypothetical protein